MPSLSKEALLYSPSKWNGLLHSTHPRFRYDEWCVNYKVYCRSQLFYQRIRSLSPWPIPQSKSFPEFSSNAQRFIKEIEAHHAKSSPPTGKQLRCCWWHCQSYSNFNQALEEFDFFSTLMLIPYQSMAGIMKEIYLSDFWPQYASYYFYLSTKFRTSFENAALPLFDYEARDADRGYIFPIEKASG